MEINPCRRAPEIAGIKAFLVDLDGTLADTAEAKFRAYSHALADRGMAVDRTASDREVSGHSWRQYLPAMLDCVHSQAVASQVARRKTEPCRENLSQARFNDALVALLQQLRRSGAQLALVTTASSANVASVMAARPDIAGLFNLLITGDDVRRHKPDPEAYCLAAHRLGLQPHECVVIEDSEIGVAAARAFGASVLRVSMDSVRP